MKNVVILALETSCDETSCSVVENGRKVLSSIVWSQAQDFVKYGGVVPEIASRKHMEYIIPTIEKALQEAEKTLNDIDVFAVANGPGLAGALLVGVSAAKGLALACGKPLLGINHLEGHIAANYLAHQEAKPPFLCLLVSGGHSHILYVKGYTDIEMIARTRDDAAGEAYDKVARVLGLGYPGGPLVDKLAQEGDPNAIDFPITKFQDGSVDFSFSGIKTAVINHVHQKEQTKNPIHTKDICASFQKAVVTMLTQNLVPIIKQKNVDTLMLAGGVAANSALRSKIKEIAEKEGLRYYYPPMDLCTDNAAMIGSMAYYRYIGGQKDGWDLNAHPSLSL